MDSYLRIEDVPINLQNAQSVELLESRFQGFLWRIEKIVCYTDCHCHLHEREFNNERLGQWMILWRKLGIAKIIAVTMDQKSITHTLQIHDRSIKESWPITIFPAIGIHPWKAHKDYEIDFLLTVLNKLKKPIIGEIGLDHRFVPRKRWDMQAEVFEEMLCVAAKHSAPVTIHTKDAEVQVLDLLSSFDLPQVILHWFTGPLTQARSALERGYCFSITPAINYSHVLKYIAQNAPLEQLMLESDGPMGYKLPFGKIIGTPGWIPMIARRICQLRESERFEDLVQTIESNITRFLE